MEPKRRETAETEPLEAVEKPAGTLLAEGIDDLPTRTGGEMIDVVLLRMPLPAAAPPLPMLPGNVRPADDCACVCGAVTPDVERVALDASGTVETVAVLIVRCRGWTSPVIPVLRGPTAASWAEGVVVVEAAEALEAEAKLDKDEILVRGLREPFTGLAAVTPVVAEEGGETIDPALDSDEVEPDCQTKVERLAHAQPARTARG